MKNLHTQETIKQNGELLFSTGDVQQTLAIYAYDGSLLYDGPEHVEVLEDTKENRIDIFDGLLYDCMDGESQQENIEKLLQVLDSLK